MLRDFIMTKGQQKESINRCVYCGWGHGLLVHVRNWRELKMSNSGWVAWKTSQWGGRLRQKALNPERGRSSCLVCVWHLVSRLAWWKEKNMEILNSAGAFMTSIHIIPSGYNTRFRGYWPTASPPCGEEQVRESIQGLEGALLDAGPFASSFHLILSYLLCLLLSPTYPHPLTALLRLYAI